MGIDLLVMALCSFAFYFSIELMEHSRDDRWNPYFTIFGYNAGRLWLNTGHRGKGEAWKNKHNWHPTWLFKHILVFLTDAEHFFQECAYWSITVLIGFFVGWPEAILFYGLLKLAGALKILTPLQ